MGWWKWPRRMVRPFFYFNLPALFVTGDEVKKRVRLPAARADPILNFQRGRYSAGQVFNSRYFDNKAFSDNRRSFFCSLDGLSDFGHDGMGAKKRKQTYPWHEYYG